MSISRLGRIWVALAAMGLALGYGVDGIWAAAPICLGLGACWLIGEHLDWRWTNALGLICFLGAAIVGIWSGITVPLLLFSTTAALVAWDLLRFAQRLRTAVQVEGGDVLMRAHVQRLLVIAAVGLLLGGISQGVQLELSFSGALLLGGLAILGLSRAVGFIQHKSD
jgi:hypothetical protein